MTDHGAFHWNELMTNDVEGAKAFYAATLGWTYDEFPAMNFTYWVCMSNGKPVGGIMPLQDVAPDGAGPHWFLLDRRNISTRRSRVSGQPSSLRRIAAMVIFVSWIAGLRKKEAG